MSKGAVIGRVLLVSACVACNTEHRAPPQPNSDAGAPVEGGLAGEGGADSGSGSASAGASGEDARSQAGSAGAPDASTLPVRTEILSALTRVNDAWMASHVNPGDDQWARAVYFLGDSAFANISGRPDELAYSEKWAESHDYGLNNGNTTTDADDQCAGQTYLALAARAPAANALAALETSLSAMTKAQTAAAWTWIDALFMAMPAFVELGAHDQDPSYFDEAFRLYDYTKRTVGGGLYNASDSLWYRDANYAPPRAEPNGKNTYWSRGNGWVFAAHARVLDALPDSDSHRAEYLDTFRAMASAVQAQQRSDGFWNVSLLDPTHFGGPETSGTSLFVYGLALGIARGWLPRDTYEPVVIAGYRGLVTVAVRADGTLGYVQGVGAAPESSQPVTAQSTADFGVGAFLLAGTAVYALAPD